MINYIILGIIQGITEFFPVSSSGHLVIFQKILGLHGNEVAVAVILHLGTCLSLILFFFRDILNMLRSIKLLFLVFIVTVITGLIGFSGKVFFENLFASPQIAGISFIATGVILLLTKSFMDCKRDQPSVKDAFTLGAVQGLAIVPGLSRSGLTISSLLFRKMGRDSAFRFSFLASLPAIFGATLLESREIGSIMQVDCFQLSVGFLFSFISGLVALWLLKIILHKAKFYYFAYYCFAIGLIALIFVK